MPVWEHTGNKDIRPSSNLIHMTHLAVAFQNTCCCASLHTLMVFFRHTFNIFGIRMWLEVQELLLYVPQLLMWVLNFGIFPFSAPINNTLIQTIPCSTQRYRFSLHWKFADSKQCNQILHQRRRFVVYSNLKQGQVAPVQSPAFLVFTWGFQLVQLQL